MIFLLSVIVLALALGYLLGGRLGGFEKLRLRWWWLAPIGLALQIQGPWLRGANAGVPLLLASYVVLMVFAVLNIRLAGFVAILAGLALNLLVVGINGGMPVTKSALITSGQESILEDLRNGEGAKHHLATDDDVLLPLADVIPIPPPIAQVVSVGDILIYGGAVWLVVATMRGRPYLRGRDESTPNRSSRTSQ